MIMHRLLKNTPGCPKANWTWVRCTDLKEDEGREYDDYEDCEFCGHEQIRFVHEIEHPDWPQIIRVGRICAAHYTVTSPHDLAKAEAILKNRSIRRQRFPQLKAWKKSSKGNPHIEYLGAHVIVLKNGSGFSLKIGSRFGTKIFGSEREAMLRAFDVLTLRSANK